MKLKLVDDQVPLPKRTGPKRTSIEQRMAIADLDRPAIAKLNRRLGPTHRIHRSFERLGLHTRRKPRRQIRNNDRATNGIKPQKSQQETDPDHPSTPFHLQGSCGSEGLLESSEQTPPRDTQLAVKCCSKYRNDSVPRWIGIVLGTDSGALSELVNGSASITDPTVFCISVSIKLQASLSWDRESFL